MTMTDTEAKALALVNEICGSSWLPHEIERIANFKALCHYIEATEARHAAELRELKERFSKAVKRLPKHIQHNFRLTPFILLAPDPLVDAMADCGVDRFESWADQLHAALAARGYEVRKIGEE